MSLKERKKRIDKIISDVSDSELRAFYSKVVPIVAKLMQEKSIPKPTKQAEKSSKKPTAKEIDALVESTYKKMLGEDLEDEEVAETVKSNLKRIFTQTQENKPANPFTKFHPDIVEIVSLFYGFAITCSEVENFLEDGLNFLSQFHPNLKQIEDVQNCVINCERFELFASCQSQKCPF